MTNGDDTREIIDFLQWFSELDQFTNKVLVAGNHDCYFDTNGNEIKKLMATYPKITYLKDELTIFTVNEQPVRVYGSPWSAYCGTWAFMVM